MLTIYLLWLSFWVICFILGQSIWRLMRPCFVNTFDINTIDHACLGFFLVYGMSVIYSSFFAIDKFFILLILFLCFLSLLFSEESFPRIVKKIQSWKNILFIFCLLILTFPVAFFSTLPEISYDTYLYHLSAVRWNHEFGIIPGLVNVHFRLGLNSSFHAFAAIFENGPFNGTAVHSALGFLMFFSIIRFLYYTFFSNRNLTRCAGILFLGLVLRIAWTREAATLSADWALSIFIALALFEIIRATDLKPCFSYKEKLFVSLTLFSFFCVLSYTTKLLGAALLPISFIATALLIWQSLRDPSFRKISVIGWTLLPYLFFLIHVAKTIILSGWLAYPMPFPNLKLPWGQDSADIMEVVSAIQTWSATQNASEISFIESALKFWKIFPDRIEFASLIFLLLVSTLYLHFTGKRKFMRELLISTSLIGAFFTSLFGFWYFGAQSLRFLGLIHHAFKATLVLGVIFSLVKSSALRGSVVTFAALWIANPGFNRELLKISYPLFPARVAHPPSVVLNSAYCAGSIVEFYRSSADDRCVNAPLPCSPEWKSTIRMFEANNIMSGFKSSSKDETCQIILKTRKIL